MPSEVHIGTSGWVYPHWRGRFYPEGLPIAQKLRFAAEQMTALEINTTFYGSARPTTFTAWHEQVTDLVDLGFRYTVKGSRYITHMKKLRDTDVALANFFATGPLLLGAALGPFLWQLPPSLAFDEALLDRFLGSLPRTAAAAQRLAAGHDARFAGRATTERGAGLAARAPLRHAVEPRHESFHSEAFVALAARHDVAVVHADTAGRHVVLEKPGGSLAYLRLHGSRRLYASRYTDAELGDLGRAHPGARGQGGVRVLRQRRSRVRAAGRHPPLRKARGSATLCACYGSRSMRCRGSAAPRRSCGARPRRRCPPETSS